MSYHLRSLAVVAYLGLLLAQPVSVLSGTAAFLLLTCVADGAVSLLLETRRLRYLVVAVVVLSSSAGLSWLAGAEWGL